MLSGLTRQIVKRAAPIAALALGAALSGCAYVNDWEDVRGVPLAELDTSGEAPTHISLAGPDKVVISEGDSLTITIEGNSDAGEALRFDRDGNRLSIARDRKVYDGSGSATVLMTMPAPGELSIAGSGRIESATLARTAELEIAGSGAISVESVEADRLEVEIAGSGDVLAAGTASVLSVEIAGSGDVRLGDLNADDVSVSIAGSGNVTVASNGTVDASIAGSGDVVVNGSATCSVSSAGSGSLTCRPNEQNAASATEDEESEEVAAD